VSELPAASPAEAAKVVTGGLLPSLARGLFSPRRAAMKQLARVDADRRTVELLSGLRRRHGGQGLRLLGGRMVLLWGRDALREVLDRSADVYAADAGAKAKGMAHFQPDALTLSRGEAWRDRRAFTESVLATDQAVHPDGERMLAVVADEVARLEVERELGWEHWEQLFDRITLRVIFGDRAREDQELTDLLEGLMGEANRIAGLRTSDRYYELYGRLERMLIDPEPGSLVARFAAAPQTDATRVVQQLPHWMFAMRDTLGANAFRALALAVATGTDDFEGLLQEAMRLWPTTPLLARETTRDTTLAGEEIKAGTQIMISNVYNHRDSEDIPDADRCVPERWADGARSDYRLNALSHGTQDCPGGPLVSLLGTAVLARVLERWQLRGPELSEPLPHSLDFYALCFEVVS
jgi:cytochrome P450